MCFTAPAASTGTVLSTAPSMPLCRAEHPSCLRPFVCDSFDWVNLVCLLHSACHHACMQAHQMHYLPASAPYWLLLNLVCCCYTLCAPTLIEYETQSVVVQFDNYILIIMFSSFQTLHERSLYNHTSSSIIFQSTPTLTLRHVHRPRKCSPIAMLSFM